MTFLNTVLSRVVDGQRKLARRKRFFEKWAKKHRDDIREVEQSTEELRLLAIVSQYLMLQEGPPETPT